MTTSSDGHGRHLILYDGLCGLCDRANRFVLKHDRGDRFRFASIQSGFGQDLLRRHGLDPRQLTTLYVVPDFDGENSRVLSRSEAVLFVFKHLDGLWRGARFFRVLPRRLRDALYHVVSANRYAVFGRFDSCRVPTPETRSKFITTE